MILSVDILQYNSEVNQMENTFKTGDSVAIYFGDTMRELLSKPLRKKGIYFMDCRIVEAEGDTLTVLSHTRNMKDKLPYKVMALCLKKDDKHILPEGVLEELREIDKDELERFASGHGYDAKEFKAAIKPYRKDRKKD
jgi:hypothetical protein